MPKIHVAVRAAAHERVRAILLSGGVLMLLLGARPAHGAAGSAPTGSPVLSVGAIQTYQTAGCPFEALPLASGTVLVSVSDQASCPGTPGIAVFSRNGGKALASRCVIPQPGAAAGNFAPAQTALYFHNASFAAADGGSGATFYPTKSLLACASAATVISQVASQFPSVNPGTNSLVIPPGGAYALIANEYGLTTTLTSQGASFPVAGSIGVVPLPAARHPPAPPFGQLLVGGSTLAGTLLSASGRMLYVTSEGTWPTTAAAGSQNPILTRTSCVQAAGSASHPNGLLTVIDVLQLEHDAAVASAAAQAAGSTTTPVLVDNAILATTTVPATMVFGTTAIRAIIAAGCSPVRMAQTSDAQPTLWVTARGDNRVLAFSEARLENETAADTRGRALIGYAPSGGIAPVGLAVFGGNQYLAVANSNRFQPNVPGNIALLGLTTAPNGAVSAKVLQTLDTDGMFPREIAVGSDDLTLYATNFLSQNFLVIPTSLK
jgi:hypothetical protein